MILDACALKLSHSSLSSSSSPSLSSPSSLSSSLSSSKSSLSLSLLLSSSGMPIATENIDHYLNLQSLLDLGGESSTTSSKAQIFNSLNEGRLSEEDYDDMTAPPTPTARILCNGCRFEIKEKYLVKVDDNYWHENCLICYTCRIPLSGSTCYSRCGQFYCKEDYIVLFGVKCMRCRLPVQSTDYVYRVFAGIYHLHCFKCFRCGHLFKKGDHYLIVDGQIICRPDYEHLLCQASICQSHLYFDQNDSNRKTPKRPRTILNTQQRKAFKLAFEKTSKPCRKVREQLAKETNLSVRVVQVWFQNQRAKMKKIQRKQEVSESNDKTCSEIDNKSNDELKSNCDSTEELDSENDDVDVDDVKSTAEREKQSSNPIAQLFHMHATYFLA